MERSAAKVRLKSIVTIDALRTDDRKSRKPALGGAHRGELRHRDLTIAVANKRRPYSRKPTLTAQATKTNLFRQRPVFTQIFWLTACPVMKAALEAVDVNECECRCDFIICHFTFGQLAACVYWFVRNSDVSTGKRAALFAFFGFVPFSLLII